jgi:hypothetical protein
MTAAFWVAVHQISVQFCSNGVTGTIIAPAFVLLSDGSVMGRTMPIFGLPPRKTLPSGHDGLLPDVQRVFRKTVST